MSNQRRKASLGSLQARRFSILFIDVKGKAAALERALNVVRHEKREGIAPLAMPSRC